MAIEAVLDEDGHRRISLRDAAARGSSRRPRLPASLARFERGDRLAVALLILLPVLLYVPFSLAGHPILPGDNLTQNFPLRVLAGEQLRAGHLPTWDPLVWSGTPLLAGWNGGSMFPATWLFALLPSIAAWTVAYTANPIVAAVGAFLLLRLLGTRAPAATVGAMAFTYTGFMNGQVVHLGLVQGTALMPWTLVALELLRRRCSRHTPLHRLAGPVALLGAAAGLTVLAGDPRAVTTTAIADGIYLVALLVRSGGGARRGALLGAAATGTVVGALLSAVQWLPGLRFVHGSQRGTTAYSFFGAGSLDLGHLASFLLVPYLFGGNGNFGLPTYAGTYNLPELTIGTGVLATVAFMAYLPAVGGAALGRLPGAGRLLKRRRPPASASGEPWPVGRPDGRALGVWYVLALVGALLTLGSTTPLGNLLVHIPLFGGERLQNRNAALIDLAFVVLLAFLLDDLLARRGAGLLRSWRTKLLCLVPLAAMTGLVLFAYADPSAMRRFDGVSPTDTWLFTSMTADNLWQLAVVAGATALVLRPSLVHRRRGRLGLAVLVVADLGLFLANASFAGAPSSVLSGASQVSRTVARLAGTGRIAIYNPLNQAPPEGPHFAQELGAPDLNVVAGLASVQGYGSVVSSAYDQATSTHGYENLQVNGLSRTTFDALDLQTLLTLPAAFATTLPPGQAPPAPGSPVPGAASSAAAIGTPAAVVGGPYHIGPGDSRTFLLPSPMAVHAVDLLLSGPSRTADTASPRLVLGAGRQAQAPVATAVHGPDATARLAGGRPVLALSVHNPAHHPLLLRAVVVDAGRPATRLALDGPLQGRIQGPHWRYQATIGSFVAWKNLRAPGRAWLQATGSRTPDPSTTAPGRVRTVATSPTDSQQTVVSLPRPALLVRSEAYAKGWTARLTPSSGGPTRVVTVRPLGIVQAVPVPAGRYTVTWRYAPSVVLDGLAASLAGLVLLGGLVLVAIVARRRADDPSAVGSSRPA